MNYSHHGNNLGCQAVVRQTLQNANSITIILHYHYYWKDADLIVTRDQYTPGNQ